MNNTAIANQHRTRATGKPLPMEIMVLITSYHLPNQHSVQNLSERLENAELGQDPKSTLTTLQQFITMYQMYFRLSLISKTLRNAAQTALGQDSPMHTQVERVDGLKRKYDTISLPSHCNTTCKRASFKLTSLTLFLGSASLLIYGVVSAINLEFNTKEVLAIVGGLAFGLMAFLTSLLAPTPPTEEHNMIKRVQHLLKHWQLPRETNTDNVVITVNDTPTLST